MEWKSRAVEQRVRRWRKSPLKMVRTRAGKTLCVVREVDDEMLPYITQEERDNMTLRCGRVNKWR
jgi:hypothetical protein